MKRDDFASGAWVKPKPGEVDQKQEDVEPGHLYYKLEGRWVYPIADNLQDAMIEWAKNLEMQNRRVARTNVGEDYVSTVFLGLNHDFGLGTPKLFETMIHKDGKEYETYRCTTYAQAEELHRIAVEALK